MDCVYPASKCADIIEIRDLHSVGQQCGTDSGIIDSSASEWHHFLPSCFGFLVLYTVYSSGLAGFHLSHSK